MVQGEVESAGVKRGDVIVSKDKSKDVLKFISTADWHWRLTNPRSRIDCFSESVSAKIFEIFDLARTIKADGILLAGDLMDSEFLSWSAVKELGKILLQSPCPIYTIGGQHEENGHDPGSLDRLPWGTLAAWRLSRTWRKLEHGSDWPAVKR